MASEQKNIDNQVTLNTESNNLERENAELKETVAILTLKLNQNPYHHHS